MLGFRKATTRWIWLGLLASLWSLATPVGAEPRQLLWGDTHLHSSNSFDAYLNQNVSADPDTAYRYAKGLPVIFPSHRARVQIETPLDFLVVSDHAEYLGVMRHIMERGIPTEDLGWIDTLKAWYIEWWLNDVMENDEGMAAFSSLLPDATSVEEAAARPPQSAIPGSETMQRTVWQEAIRIADAHDDPGRFTTLIGWEWSSIPAGANLHRVVLTSADSEVASRFQPTSSSESMYPEDLWKWLEETSERTGAEFVAIPHNSNISKGYMFAETSLRGAPYDAELARTRIKWEPVVEATQFKGDSETHPDLSPDDPFADFELYPHYIQQNPPPYRAHVGDYLRPALLRGLAMERRVGVNPFQFGMIGSTDSHTGMSSAEEPNFWGKFPRDSIPETKATRWRGSSGPSGWSMSASGLAAVWAEENSRDAIVEALRRREVYATTGPRIAVRVQASWDPASAETPASESVPMGGQLPAAPAGAAPRISVQALADPKGAYLDRIQIIKGWMDAGGATHERIFDVAASDGRVPMVQRVERGSDAEGGTHERVFDVPASDTQVAEGAGQLAAVGNTVDPNTGRYRNDIGSPELSASWRDPDFDPAQPAFYYARVIEIPTPRHSLFDALALGLDPREIRGAWWIQERAYTSPVWYNP